MADERVLVTGGNRGLGLELVRAYLERGAHVFTTAREPGSAKALTSLGERFGDRLAVVELDIEDVASIRHVAGDLARRTTALDIVISSAGIYSASGSAPPTEKLGTLDAEEMLRVFRTNSVGPIMLAQELLGLLRIGKRPRFVAVSSELGSISQNDGGFPYYYAASKAALNQLTRTLAADPAAAGLTAMAVDPGLMRTAMGEEYGTPPAEVAAGLVALIDEPTERAGGTFRRWDGASQPW